MRYQFLMAGYFDIDPEKNCTPVIEVVYYAKMEETIINETLVITKEIVQSGIALAAPMASITAFFFWTRAHHYEMTYEASFERMCKAMGIDNP